MGGTPLYHTAKKGGLSLVEAILEHPEMDLSCGDEWKPLATAASEGHADVKALGNGIPLDEL